MGILINYKICDNAEDCPAIRICPVGAIYFDRNEELLKIDNEKCISCFKCVSACDINALRMFNSKEEKQKVINELSNIKMNQEELCVDRYGAQPIDENKFMEQEEFLRFIKENNERILVEFFDEDYIECMFKSIPIENLLKNLNISSYLKINLVGNKLKEIYSVKKLPAIFVFENGNIKNKAEGFFTKDEEEKLISILKETI